MGDQFDDNNNEQVDREEVTAAIREFLFASTPDVSREDVTEIIRFYLFN